MTLPSLPAAPGRHTSAWRWAALVATAALAACADMSGIDPQANLRDPAATAAWER